MARNRRNDEDVQVDTTEGETVQVRLSATSPISLLHIGNQSVSRTQSASISVEDYERLRDEYGLEVVDE
ncbi:MAG: hypothetical protein KatS3mg051_1559 [Anaerolineae bacterium]|nr:MAG: hypothetical protein KatS3mg051_1559 [Anaerolineae bacterium]